MTMTAFLFRNGLIAAMAVYLFVVRLLSSRRRPVRHAEGADVLLTGTFHAENWVRAHTEPLGRAALCRRVRVVSVTRVPALPGVEWVEPPRWLQRLAGGVPARLLVFAWLAVRDRPQVVGGFHLLLNGLVAILVGRLTGARSIYFSVGGPEEMRDGGLFSENRLFVRIGKRSATLERQLHRAACQADQIVTMGNTAARFFAAKGAQPAPMVIAGAIDPERYAVGETVRDIDLLLVGRLARIKRIDLFIDAVDLVRPERPGVRAVIVGDGELRETHHAHVRERGLESNVEFAGQQPDVRPYLHRARVFCLTSDSEGLALSLMEAAMCGVPAVVSRVGDLGDLVTDGVNGYLVGERSARAFADRMLDLLADDGRLAQFRSAARAAAERYQTAAVSQLWDDLLGTLTAPPAKPSPKRSAVAERVL